MMKMKRTKMRRKKTRTMMVLDGLDGGVVHLPLQSQSVKEVRLTMEQKMTLTPTRNEGDLPKSTLQWKHE